MHINHPVRRLASLALLALAPALALAHPGHGADAHAAGSHLLEGLLHPLTGLDHLLMITAVSAWAALLQPRHRVVVALALAACVGIGAVLNTGAGALLEAAIALTVLGSGVLLAVGRSWPAWATALLAAGFALIHGLAHGTEGPAHSGAYLAGLMLATAGNALVVSFVAAALQRQRLWWRIGGALSATTGAASLAIS